MFSKFAYIAANRFGYGANAQTLASIDSAPVKWLLSQIEPTSVSEAAKRYTQGWRSREALRQVYQFNQQKRANRNPPSAAKKDVSPEIAKREVIAKINRHIEFPIIQAITGPNPFYWHLVDFFSNHFSVSHTNLMMKALAPTLESEAIAPHISGNFADMLIAVERHPAMLIYLNNERSAGPNSRFARKREHKGMNENLAREILELHTLGVKSSYTQTDVIELSKALTGWSLGNPRKNEPLEFTFRKGMHEPGKRHVLGKVYSQEKQAQGEAILNDLAMHSDTSRHICYKLVRHFVSDKPPETIVNDMVACWQHTSGHLKSVITTMLRHPDSWTDDAQKLKTPRELIISAFRSFALNKRRPKYARDMEILGQAPFSAGSPAGYQDTKDGWTGPRAMMSRIEWADNISPTIMGDPIKLANQALGPLLRNTTAEHLMRAESKRQAMTLLLMSPEFQRR